MKKAIDRRQFGIGGVAATALAAGGRARAQSGPLKIRIGWVVVPASLGPLVLEKKELLTHFGFTVDHLVLAARHLLGRAAGPLLGVGQLRFSGIAPNGGDFTIAPTRVWAVSRSHALLNGADLGPSRPLERQARLGGLRLPQRGLYAVGQGHFGRPDPAASGRGGNS